ncbi:uncharacterized protein LOC120275047 [Dioscorea cayenensis subsp. rotundata]|uniref:Uncharacterized protein LOC120275047 n=1 Tax=Dioscorea cayennensis subsp. rotundata TaxID=55577 RepID=A0AB40CCD9_DIOCR|nr:uncharacterized protein LOC120275047 [Dioscorea cayenensis subsp. rotundata]
MTSWFGWKKSKKGGGMGVEKKVVLDGSEIRELVENKEAFGSFIDHKFEELDLDRDGKLSVSELHPAVADIGAALGLPAQGSSPDSDHIYSEVLSEFTHGKQEEVSKSEFKEVLSDILLGMAAGLNRDPIVILRMDGEDLKEFVRSPGFEPEAIAIYSSIDSANAPLSKCLLMGLQQLTVEHGLPPISDSWVSGNIVEPAFQSISGDHLEQPATQETFLEEFKKLVISITRHLEEQLVIVAHSENTFDGNGIKRLLSNSFELNKLLDNAWRDLPKDQNGKVSKDYLRIALDGMASSANLPPFGAVQQVDAVVNEAFKMVNADDGKTVDEQEFKKLMTEILGSIMLQLQGNAVFVSSNSVIHETLPSSSTLLPPVSGPSV